jgi:peptidoglycan/xylan/chitin deacetylase (PgdA/CDA1 family)
LRQIAAEHHTIGTHTWSHRYLNVIRHGAEDQIVGGFLAAAKAVGPQTPELSPFFRFPGFGRTARLERFLDAHGMVPFSVDVVGDDWTRISSDEVLRRTLSRLEARRGGILLLHDIHARTLAMLPQLLVELKARGFSIVHIVPENGDAQTALASLPPLSSDRMRLALARIPAATPINLDLAQNGRGEVVVLADLGVKDGKSPIRNFSDLSSHPSTPSR